MPAVELKTGKYIIIKEEPVGSGNFIIPVNQTPTGEFEVPVSKDEGTEQIYKPKVEVDTNRNWILPLIEHSDGNGHIPIERKT